jgi:hypothetical protein
VWAAGGVNLEEAIITQQSALSQPPAGARARIRDDRWALDFVAVPKWLNAVC